MSDSSFTEHISSRAGAFLGNYSLSDEFKQRYSVWTRFLDKYAHNANFAYDIGCGPGLFSFYLAEKGLEVEGWDGSDGMIELCEAEKAKKSDKKTKFRKLLVPVSVTHEMKVADLLISSSVIEYVEDTDATVKMFNQLLKKDGILLVSFPNRSSWYRSFEKLAFRLTGRPSYYRYVKHLWALEEARKVFEVNGFVFLESEYYANRSAFSKAASVFGKKVSSNLIIAAFRKK